MTWNELKKEVDEQLLQLGKELNRPDLANGDVEVWYIDIGLTTRVEVRFDTTMGIKI